MADQEPDFASCSDEDLSDIACHLDREAYPERWLRLQDQIAQRRRKAHVVSSRSHVVSSRERFHDSDYPVTSVGPGRTVIIYLAFTFALGCLLAIYLSDGNRIFLILFPSAVIVMVALVQPSSREHELADRLIGNWARKNGHELLEISAEGFGDRLRLFAGTMQVIRRVTVRTADGSERRCLALCGGIWIGMSSSSLQIAWQN